MKNIAGLHHITAIAGPAQENLDFYAGVLGMRLVKKSVNQDDPTTYHLFYADAAGQPGTDITFFPWAELAPPRDGYGLSSEASLTVPPGALDFWEERLRQHEVQSLRRGQRFGRDLLGFSDPHGLALSLVENEGSLGREFSSWEGTAVPGQFQIRGLESARLVERELDATVAFLRDSLGFEKVGEEDGWERYALRGQAEACLSGTYLDLRAAPQAPRGAWGTGSVHHLAWRVTDEAQQLEVRQRAIAGGAHPTPVIDRFWFKSVYFREPGGVLFELATDGPGFAVDEPATQLGETLVLPPWLEPDRVAIEAVLPRLKNWTE